MELFRFKKISCPLCFFWQSGNETLIHLFHGYIKTNLLCYKLKKFLKTKIDPPMNTPQNAIFGFLNYENNSDIMNHLLLIFKYYLYDSRERKKLSLEVLKKEIMKIYNIEKQICLNNFKRKERSLCFFCIYFIAWVSTTVRVHLCDHCWHYIITTSSIYYS